MTLTVSASSRWGEAGQEWWKNIEYLASDDLQGRNVGTPGFDLAASYVAAEYKRTGLTAAAADGYFQWIRFAETSLVSANINLLRHGEAVPIDLPSEAAVNYDAYSSADIKARVVFAGYGLTIPEAGYDDLKGLPIKGAVVAYLIGSPDTVPGNLRAHYELREMRWRTLRAAGAIGTIAIPNPKMMEMPWSRQTANFASSRVVLADPLLNRFKGLQFSATWNPAQADDLLAGSGHSFAEILQADDNHNPLPHFSIGCSLRAKISVKSRLVVSKNVVAVHPGRDQNLKDEYVVVSAHLDHLGAGKQGDRHAFFPGVMDDASGVSSLIEIAKMLKNVSTKRSILFVALTGEETGELGSEYFARYPPVKGRIVADLNMDMFLPLFPLKWLEVQGLDESTLGADVKEVAGQVGVQVQSDKEPDKNRLIRSDQYSFIKAGVPALAFKFGYQKGDPEEEIFQRWYAIRYHDMRDNLDQPVDLEAAAQFNDILKSLLVRVADADDAPRWHDDSFFKRFVASAGM